MRSQGYWSLLCSWLPPPPPPGPPHEPRVFLLQPLYQASSFCPAPVSNTSSSQTPNATGVNCPPPAGSVIQVAPCPHFLPWGHLLQSSYVYFSGDRLTGPTPQAPATAGWLPHPRLMLWLKLSVSSYSGTDAVAFSQATCVLCPAMQQSNNQFDTLLWSLADLVRLLEILKEEISGF